MVNWLLVAVLILILLFVLGDDSGACREGGPSLFSENFTSNLKEGDIPPCVSNYQNSVIPYAKELVVQNYNYQNIQIGHLKSGYVIPVNYLGYYWDSDGMTYYFTLDGRDPNSEWVLDTYPETIPPKLFNGKTGEPLVATPIDKGLWGFSL